MAKEYFSTRKESPVQKEASVVSTPNAAPVVTESATITTLSGAGNGSATSPTVSQTGILLGDEQAGQSIFKTNCATCHRYGQQGNNIGPDLTKISQKFDKNTLLEAIVNPSAGIAFGYEPWLITTKTGQTYYGFLVSDGEQTVVIKGVTGQKHTIPTDKVFSRRQYRTSLMPDAVSMGLNDRQLADLTAYLLKQ
jgi:putative heme-binding domain-containing protein